MADVSGKEREDDKACSYGAQGGDSGHPKRSKREGDAGRRPLLDGLPQVDGVALMPEV